MARSYPSLPPRTYLPPAVDSLPLIPNDGWLDFTTKAASLISTTTTRTTTLMSETTYTTPTITVTTTTTINTAFDDDDSDGQVGLDVMSGSVIDGESVEVGDENGHTQELDGHDNVQGRPSDNALDFVLVEPVQQTQLAQMKT